jgi:hypothetical protein
MMLWSKGWHETKWRVLWCLILFAITLASEYLRGVRNDTDVRALIDNLFLLWLFFPLILSGDGVHSPSGLRMSRGVHGSAYFTLGLPVSRFRLLAARAGIGMVETMGIIVVVIGGIWALFPVLRETATPADAAGYFLVLVASTCGFYALSVLLAVVVAPLWRVWFSFGLLILARWGMAHLNFPETFDCFRAIASGSPLLTHSTPWLAMMLPIGMAAILFATASKIAEQREY